MTELVTDLKETDELNSFIKRHGNTPAKLQVLLFWGRHPRGRFTIDCIVDALDTRKLYLKDAIETLVAEGVLRKQQDNGITFLSINPSYRNQLEALIKLKGYQVKYWANYYTQEL